MAVRFITVAEVRAYSGVSVALVSDADLTEIIEDIEYQVEKFLNADFVPHVEIDSRDGNAKPYMFTKRSPLLTVRALEINDTSIPITVTDFKKTGKITLLTGSDLATFTRVRKAVFIKYVHGRVAWDKLTETTTTGASIVGSSIVLAVDSETGFSINDWVEITSFDGNKEAAKVTATASGTITVDQLIFAHATGALVRLLAVDPTILRYMKIWASMATITRVVGESFDEITGYTMGEFQVQKGEPFTQWREAMVRLEKQAMAIAERVRPTPGIQVNDS